MVSPRYPQGHELVAATQTPAEMFVAAGYRTERGSFPREEGPDDAGGSAGQPARMSSNDFGLIPLAAIHGPGFPTTPVAICESAVDRAGLRHPSHPIASAVAVIDLRNPLGSRTGR